MDRAEHGRIVSRLVNGYAALQPSHGNIRIDAACDDESGVYVLVHAGWDRGRRVHGLLLYIRLDEQKVVVEYDGIYHGVYDDLIAAGVADDDIVLAFRREQPVLQTTR